MAVFSSAKAAREPSSRPRQGEAVVIVRLRARRWAGYRAVTVMLFVVAAVDPGCTSLTGSNCESFPIPQFGLHGLVYQRLTAVGEPVAAADVVDAVETINDSSLPSAASRCGRYTLADGRGTLAVGTKIYSIKGVDPAVALAVPDGTGYVRFEPRLPPSQRASRGSDRAMLSHERPSCEPDDVAQPHRTGDQSTVHFGFPSVHGTRRTVLEFRFSGHDVPAEYEPSTAQTPISPPCRHPD